MFKYRLYIVDYLFVSWIFLGRKVSVEKNNSGKHKTEAETRKTLTENSPKHYTNQYKIKKMKKKNRGWQKRDEVRFFFFFFVMG